MFRVNQHRNTHWCQAFGDGVANLRRHGFLGLQAFREDLDHTGEFRNADDLLRGHIGNVGDAEDRNDVVLAVGTELSEVDSFEATLELPGKLIRVDIDNRKMNDLYPAEIALLGSAQATCKAILRELGEGDPRPQTAKEVAAIKRQFRTRLDASQRRHCVLLDRLREILPSNTRVMGDACQLVYTGAFMLHCVDARRVAHVHESPDRLLLARGWEVYAERRS